MKRPALSISGLGSDSAPAPTYRAQSEEQMLEEIRTNAVSRMRAIERQQGIAPKLQGHWAPSELWPGQDWQNINAFFPYAIV